MLGCPDLPRFANLEGLQHVQDAALRCAETAGTHDDSLSSAVKAQTATAVMRPDADMSNPIQKDAGLPWALIIP